MISCNQFQRFPGIDIFHFNIQPVLKNLENFEMKLALLEICTMTSKSETVHFVSWPCDFVPSTLD